MLSISGNLVPNAVTKAFSNSLSAFSSKPNLSSNVSFDISSSFSLAASASCLAIIISSGDKSSSTISLFLWPSCCWSILSVFPLICPSSNNFLAETSLPNLALANMNSPNPSGPTIDPSFLLAAGLKFTNLSITTCIFLLAISGDVDLLLIYLSITGANFLPSKILLTTLGSSKSL